MADSSQHKPPTRRAEKIGTVIALVFCAVMLAVFWPQLFSELTVRELSDDFMAYAGWTIRVRGTVAVLHPCDFGVGECDNYIMYLDDNGARIKLMFDRMAHRYKPEVGDRVRVVGNIYSYGDHTPEMLVATRIKKLE